MADRRYLIGGEVVGYGVGTKYGFILHDLHIARSAGNAVLIVIINMLCHQQCWFITRDDAAFKVSRIGIAADKCSNKQCGTAL